MHAHKRAKKVIVDHLCPTKAERKYMSVWLLRHENKFRKPGHKLTMDDMKNMYQQKQKVDLKKTESVPERLLGGEK